jgi:O-methyltransferase involved in polyketide biosynthesis
MSSPIHDVSDTAFWIAHHRALETARPDARAARSLVLTEGVVPYLANEEVATLAGDLRAMRGARYWIVDYFSAFAQSFRARRRVSRAMQNAPFKFAPGDWFAFFAAHRWRPREVRYFFDEAQRFKRPVPLPWQWRMLMRLARPWTPRTRREAWQRSAGYALLEPATEDSAPNS